MSKPGPAGARLAEELPKMGPPSLVAALQAYRKEVRGDAVEEKRAARKSDDAIVLARCNGALDLLDQLLERIAP